MPLEEISFGLVAMQRSQIPLETLGLAKRGANRAWPSNRIENSWLPAIQAGPKSGQIFNRQRKAPTPNKNEPFDYHDLLKEVGHSEPDARNLLGPSNAYLADLEGADGVAAIQNEKRRCADCIRLAKSQRETADALQVARNVIESLEASVSLLQARLAFYEGGKKAPSQVVPHFGKEEHSLSTQEGRTTGNPGGPSDNEPAPHIKSKTAERTITPTEKRAESFDGARSAEPAFAAMNLTAFGQADSQTRKDRAETLVRVAGKIRALAAVLATQSKQIEQLKSANAELVTRETQFAKKLRVAEDAQKDAQETILFQAKTMELMVSERQAERNAAEYDTARLLCALRHERSERRTAERDMKVLKNELVLLLPKLTAESRPTEHDHTNKQISNLLFRAADEPNGYDSRGIA